MKKKQTKKIDFTIGDTTIDNNKKEIVEISKNLSYGKEKAAKLLIALGPEQASLILKELSENEISILVEEMLKIKKISNKEKKEILNEFYESLREDFIYSTGKEEAKKILEKLYTPEKTNEIIKKAEHKDIKKEIQYIENFDPKLLASILREENPQIIAIILAMLKPAFAANILKNFEPEKRNEILIRIANTSQIFPEGLEKSIRILKEKLEKKSNEYYSEMSGIQTAVAILNHLDRKHENEILEFIEEKDKDLLERIKAKLYTFEELENLDFEELRLLLSKIDAKIIALSLIGMPENFKKLFLNSLSQNKASDVLFELDLLNNVPLKKIQDARNHILNFAKTLDEQGEIIIKKEKEDLY
ncbi:MAG: flagellar motor switch protein FliG [Leptonema sp. (in: bacteria)]